MKTKLHSLLVALALAAGSYQAAAQGTAFTYQGHLNDGANPATGSYDLTFSLFNVVSGAGQVGATITNSATGVSNGLFTVVLDFGANFPGADRWLEIGVRTNGGGTFATLAPRQKLLPTPYAIFANTAGNLSGIVPLADLPPTVAQLNDSGTQNFFAGGGAGNLTLTGAQNSGIGFAALGADTSGGQNVANGFEALFSNTTGSGNTASGYEALFFNTNGIDNTATGEYALHFNTSGTDNTATGVSALYANTTGIANTATGWDTLVQNTTGVNNTATGSSALYFNVSGGANTASGTLALENNNVGSFNTANGYEALEVNQSGDNNTADGAAALPNLTTGSFNIALGQNSGTAIVTGNNNIDIGNAGFGDESGVIRIGTSQTKAVMVGIYGATIASGGTPVYVNGSGLLGTITSSRRFKKNIQNMVNASAVLLALRPVTFEYKPELDPVGTPQFGLVAEEVEKVDPALVVHDDKHQIYSVRYEAVNAMLLNEFLKQHGKVEEQSRKAGQQDSEIETLKKQNASLTERLNELEAAMKSLAEKK